MTVGKYYIIIVREVNKPIKGGSIMRIQFTVSQMEWNDLQLKATKEGYPDVPSYCKDVVLNQRTYATLWNTVTKKIKSMPAEKTFVLRDLVDTPPSNLGVKLYNHQKELGIEVIKKDSMNTNMFKKL